MTLRYMFADKRKTLVRPFHVKSTWQPPIQNSVALERYLEETKLKLTSTVFHAPLDNISANERKAIGSLKRNSEINLKKADKGKLQSLLTKSTSPQLLRSQDLDHELSRLRRSGNDRHYKSLLAQSRCNQNDMVDYRSSAVPVKGVHMQMSFKLAANL